MGWRISTASALSPASVPSTVSIAAVGLDLDYTLCAPARERAALLDEATAAVDAPPIDRGDYLDAHRRNLTGETRAPIFDELLDGPETPAPDVLARAYRERVNDALRPVDGADELLGELRDRYRVGLLTNGPAVAQRGKLAALGWTDAFDAVCISGELPAGKPDTRAFGALLEALDAAPDETAYVGDDVEADVAGSTAAGLHAVQVVRSGGPPADARAEAYVNLATVADELPPALAGLG